jgi:hypothetical protein
MTLLWTCSKKARELGLPAEFATVGPPFDEPDVPVEAMILLPSGAGNERFVQTIHSNARTSPVSGVGLFLNDPFLRLSKTVALLKASGVSWVANLPSVAQHDRSFRQQLDDVGFTVTHELNVLAQFRVEGFKTLAVVSDPTQCGALSDHPVDAVLRVQTTSDVQISFPSETQRTAAADDIARELRNLPSRPPVMPLVTELEFSRIDYPAIRRPVFALSPSDQI